MQEKQKLNFDVPVELHERIKAQADQEERSMASWIRLALQDQLDRAERGVQATTT